MGIVVVGSINVDISVSVERHPQPGETLMGVGHPPAAGGKGANQAVAAALLGAEVTLVGAVGNDAHSDTALRFIRNSGINTDHIEQVNDITGMALITVSETGENTIVVVPGANAHVGDAFVDKQASAIATGDLVLLQGEIPAAGFKQAIRHARGRVVVNLAPVIAVDTEALLEADPLVVNEHEAQLVLDMYGHSPLNSATETVRTLRQLGFASVVLTLGTNGSVVADTTGTHHIGIASIDVVDTTGAGDAYTGALCHRLLQGDSLIDAASYASRVAAFAVTGHGAQSSYPDSDEVLPALDPK